VESGTWGQFLFFAFLGFLGPNRKILNSKLFRIKISIDLDSLQTYPRYSRYLLKIYLKNRVYIRSLEYVLSVQILQKDREPKQLIGTKSIVVLPVTVVSRILLLLFLLFSLI